VSDETTELPATTTAAAPIDVPSPERARVCPSCGAFNVTQREVCRRCAADLETGASLPWPNPDPDPTIANSAAHDAPHPRRWMLAAAAVIAAAGLLLLGLVLAEVGPFADGPSVPDATFSEAVYPDEPHHLPVSDVATMTTRPPDGDRVYVAAGMVDDTPETAWRSDGLQDQILDHQALEIIDLFLVEPGWVDQVLIRNGDQFDLEAYEEEGRLRQVRVTFDGGPSYLLNLLDEGRGQQVVELPEPQLTTMVRFEVLDLFPGSVSDGVGVSDLELSGWPATEVDAELAHERADALPATAPRNGNG
jgi:hypothetical protein